MSRVPVGVLISGSGTNLQALIDAAAAEGYPGRIAVVISNRRDAHGLERARQAGIPAVHLGHRRFDSREAYDTALVACLREHDVEWVAMAGFMRIVTSVLLDAFPNRVLNVHPALLPAFPGLNGGAQAVDYGARIAGVTIHLVDGGTDTGPIIAQGAAPVLQGDDEDALMARLHPLEHRLYPMALRWACEGRLTVSGRLVKVELLANETTFFWADA